MRVYKFLDKHFGLKSLYERRLKIARIEELNDPFELTPYNLQDPMERRAFNLSKEEMGKRFGMVCFSSCWSDPVIWAHYSDKHRGICLGFEIQNNRLEKIKYVRDRLPFPQDFMNLSQELRQGVAKEMIFTKYENWQYEDEWRTWETLETEEDGLFFIDFNDTSLRIAQVIIGERCTLQKSAVVRALGDLAGGVELTKARAAFGDLKIVADQRGLK